MSATLIKLANSHRLTPVVGFDEKTGHSYYGSRRPTVSNRTRFLATPQTVTSFLVGANARYHSRSPFLISAFQLFPCGFTEPTLALGRGQARAPNPLPTRQVSARFRPRTMTDSPALQPLHSSRSSPAFRRNNIGSMPGLCSFVPSAANWRDSQE